MSIPFLPSLRDMVFLLVSALFVLGAVDGGSVFLTRMSVPDAARQAGYAAAAAAENQPTTRQTAMVAFRAARKDAATRNLVVRPKDFTLYPDGRVTLTADRTAPTMLLHRISALRHLTDVSVTVTVSKYAPAIWKRG